jgi:tRNA(Ser,Leu) C12 N-acetylase TAN1
LTFLAVRVEFQINWYQLLKPQRQWIIMSSQDKPTNASAGNKRKYYDRGGGKKHHRNPKRGGPGVLLTSETQREHKCQVEGLDILKHYLARDASDKGEEDTPLSMEEELKMLKSKADARMFGVYETGCRGTVFVLCTIPGCNLIPAIKCEDKKPEGESGPDPDNDKKAGNDCCDGGEVEAEGVQAKKQRQEEPDPGNDEKKSGKEETVEETSPKKSEELSSEPSWDPIATVRNIMSDLKQNSKTAPSSRFVTRMIPMQATCFASVEEIRLTSQELIKKYLPLTAKTFAVAPKRRMCGNITTKQIIDTVADLVLESIPGCKVKLENPDFTIVVEVCKTLCGISVVQKCEEFRNFNLVAAREQNEPPKE